MKLFLTVYDNPNIGPSGKDDIVHEHDTVDAARSFAGEVLAEKATTEVFIYRLEQRARAETVVRFDGGIDTGNGGGDTVT